MAPRIGIIADDFTSAMDGAGPFVASGAVGTAVAVMVEAGHAPEAELVSVDADTRSRPASHAPALIETACAMVAGAEVLYKTVDSTLRGHLAAEIEMAWRTAGRRRVVFAPAFPAAGRTTRNGFQLLDGGDLAESSFARDGRQAVETGEIAKLLEPLPSQLWAPGSAPPPDGTIAICDAETDADLDAIVASVDDAEVLWIGSPGMAQALARKHARTGEARPAIAAVERVGIVIGSMHALNRIQLERLEDVLGDAVQHITSDAEAPTGPVAVAMAPLSDGPVTPDAAKVVAADLAQQARGLMDAGVGALVVTGGETARSLVASLDEPTVAVLDEPRPGIVRGRLANGAVLVTKAGGFGDADTFVELYRLLTGTSP
jgi:D-threonate/D-erythronate kinase